MPPLKDLTGNRYGELIVVQRCKENNKHNIPQWECKCNCGNTKIINGSDLKSGYYKSCGCKKYEGFKKHIDQDKREGTRLTALHMTKGKRNKSGVKGVCKHRGNKWRAYIGFKGKQINLGVYEDKEDAIKARKQAEKEYYEPIK